MLKSCSSVHNAMLYIYMTDIREMQICVCDMKGIKETLCLLAKNLFIYFILIIFSVFVCGLFCQDDLQLDMFTCLHCFQHSFLLFVWNMFSCIVWSRQKYVYDQGLFKYEDLGARYMRCVWSTGTHCSQVAFQACNGGQAARIYLKMLCRIAC